ncbi:MAG: L,D-transpeptidase [Ignavibacteria bacterium]|nr:L,D-transpeptidase [Ignavibacteria bacterium]
MQHYSASKRILLLGLFTLLTSLCFACGGNFGTEEVADRVCADSLEKVAEMRAAHIDSLRNRFGPIKYSRVHVSNSRVLDSIRRTFAKTSDTWLNYRVLTLLNRKDLQFVRIGDSLVLPDSVVKDLRAYSVFPQYYPAADTIPKLLLISNVWQSYACYRYGELVRFAAANTGSERKPTLPGRYAVNWKQIKRLSSLDSTWVLPFTINFHQYAGNAFHQFEMPGRPVSHSCVRQFLVDAEWLYKWVRPAKLDSNRRPIPFTGTPVVIIDYFDYSRRRGGDWLELANNSPVVKSMPADPMSTEEALIPMSQIPKDVRGALPNRKMNLAADSILRFRGVIRDHVSLSESIDFNKLRRAKRAAQEKNKVKRDSL